MNLALSAETLQPASFDLASILMNPAGMQALLDFGAMMAKSVVTVPKHLQGKPADCTAVCLQAAQWKMNPFAVAQKTHVSQGGALGYEAQLVNAVIVNSGALQGRPEFEFIGDWDRILGRVEERKSEKENGGGGKYYVAAWSKADEQGLGVIVTALLTGETEPRSIRVMLTQAYPRFSTQWATDPQQQITYLGVRKFARRYVPDAILGVYTIDELQASEPGTKHMGPVDEVGAPPSPPPPPPPPSGPPVWPEDAFRAQLARWKRAVEEGLKTVDNILTMARTKGALSAEQEAAIRALRRRTETVDADGVIDAQPSKTEPAAQSEQADPDFVDAYTRAEGSPQ